MLQHNKIIKVLANLLVIAITFMQVSTATALIVDVEDVLVSLHVQHGDVSSVENADCVHNEAQLEKADCCMTNDCSDRHCAEKSCASSVHSVSTAVFLSQTRIPHRLFSKSRIQIQDHLQVGLNSLSLYRPPR